MTISRSDSDPFGVLLKHFRKRQHLTQQQLAEALGIHRNTIGRWEEGSFLPESKALVLDLARCLHLDEQGARQLLDASLIAPVPAWSVPYSRNPFFTGREEMLARLHEHLRFGQQITQTQSYALHGLGGIGKTQLALEYAYRYALEYSAIFWIGAETVEQTQASLLHIAERLDLPEWIESDQQRIVAAVQRWLETRSEWLLIWDNLEDLDLPSRLLPSGRQGAVLITTRSQALGTLAHGIDLTPMGQEEGMLFMLRRSRVLEPEATNAHLDLVAASRPDEYAAASELVTALGGLPLALDQAGAYIEETGCSLVEYWHYYEQQRRRLLARRGISGGGHPHSVTATFVLASERVEREQNAANLLRVCAFLYAEAIPEELFGEGATHLGPEFAPLAVDPAQFNEAVAVLRRFSLVQRQHQTHTLSLHRLVQAVLLDTMTEAEREQWTRRVISALDAVFPDVLPTTEYATWQRGERLLPHALASLHRAGTAEESLTLASLACKAAQYLRVRARYAEAEPLYLRALRLQEQALGLDHPDVATSLNYLAGLYREQVRYAEAESLYQRALHIREQALGSEHFDVARALNNLAILYNEQGRFVEAEPLYQRALHICEQILDPDHLQLASLLNNLAIFYTDQEKHAEAEPLYQRALHIWEQTLEPDHLLVATSLYNLANLYQNQERYAEAEPLCQRALHIREQALGPDHPLVAYPLNNLANFYYNQGKFVEAETLYQRALHIWEQSLGSDHPDLAYSLNGLANLFRDQGKYAEAESLYQRALAIREQHLGQQHPNTAQTLHDLAIFRQKQGKLDEALSFAQRALTIRSESLGETHPKTVTIRTHYAQLVREQADGGEDLE